MWLIVVADAKKEYTGDLTAVWDRTIEQRQRHSSSVIPANPINEVVGYPTVNLLIGVTVLNVSYVVRWRLLVTYGRPNV